MTSLKKINKVHFIGIGGIGMSALARFMLREGKKVSGSDASESDLVRDLQDEGAEIYIGHTGDHIADDVDLVVYTIAVQHSNPELERAHELNIPTASYPEMLGVISKGKYTIAVAGTHGKTTTTAMLAQVLKAADKDPTVVVGSLLDTSIAQGPHGSRTNLIHGESDLLVVEACEYRRSFLNLSPDILIITNIDRDHLDYYDDLEDIQSAFEDLVERVPEGGYVVCNPSDEAVAPVISKCTATVIDYTDNDTPLSLRVPGEYNQANACAAHAAAELINIDSQISIQALSDFKGTWRRAEKVCESNGAVVYDDYAHHPTEIRAALSGFRSQFPDKKIVVIFQPHLYSRTKMLLSDFATAFADADEVILLPIYAAREVEDPSVSSDMLAGALMEHEMDVSVVGGLDAATRSLQERDLENHLVITMGAGDVYKVGKQLCYSGGI